ncbi:MAG: T9SS type A sorting domain-containing protein [Flavobacteriales bacterium]
MKKLYTLTLAVLGLSLMSYAQFTDDLESYDEGSLFNEYWTTWDGNDDGAQNAIVTTAQASSGTKSVLIGAGPGPQDAVLDFGGVATDGAWSASWMMYVPDGKSAYINLQGSIVPNANASLQFLSGNITFNAAGDTPGLGNDDNADGPSSFIFPHDEWFPVVATVNFDQNIYNLTVNGNSTAAAPIGLTAQMEPITVWGGVDFYAADAENEYYVDDVEFYSDPLSVEDIDLAEVSLFPNPSNGKVIIETPASLDELSIFNLIGEEVFTANDFSSQELDLTHLNAGYYLVQAMSGDTQRTFKFIKN